MDKGDFDYVILFPSGEFFAKCTRRKFDRYITKNLCKKIDAKTIQLTFQPKIKDTSKFIYMHTEEIEKCVVCGEKQQLVKKHIIPPEFVKWIPDGDTKKDSNANRIFLCKECDSRHTSNHYELRENVLKSFGIETSREHKYNIMCAKKLLCNDLPDAMKKQYRDKLIANLGHEPTNDELTNMANVHPYTHNGNKLKVDTDVAKIIVDQCIKENKIDEFLEFWKKYFIAKMKPQFMPAYTDLKM